MRFLIFLFLISLNAYSQNNYDKVIFNIISDISKERIKDDIVTLANFGTRHTLSDTVSNERGIGAARRWIKKTFESIALYPINYTKNYNAVCVSYDFLIFFN